MAVPGRKVPIVLVCDADEAERKAVTQALSAAGIEVKNARDGGRALEISVLDTPDLVVFDSESGVLDAGRFCEILRGNPRTSNTPVIVIGFELRGVGSQPGGGIGLNATFVPRPFTVEALTVRVRELLRSRTAAAQVAETPAASVVSGNLAGAKISVPFGSAAQRGYHVRFGNVAVLEDVLELGSRLDGTDGRLAR